MVSELGRGAMLGNSDNASSFGIELELGHLLREQRKQEADDRERELNIYRSGSAPPTVEGSLSAVGGLLGSHKGNGGGGGGGGVGFTEFSRGKNGNVNGVMSEEELRADPAYLSYYYSNVNLNPRLPPPLLSKEDWRFAQRLRGGSSEIGDTRKGDSNGSGRSPFALPPGFNVAKKQENDNESNKWGGDGLIFLPGLGMGSGSKQKSLEEIFQDDLSCSTPASRHPSRPVSCNDIDENSDAVGSFEAELVYPHSELASINASHSSTNVQISSGQQHAGSAASYSYAAALGGSLSRSITPDPEHIARVPSPCLAPIGGGRTSNSERRSVNSAHSFNDVRTHPNEPSDLVAALSGINLSNGTRKEGSNFPSFIGQGVEDHNSHHFNLPGGENNSKQHGYVRKSVPQSGEVPYPESVARNSNISEPRLSSLNVNMHKGVSYDPYLKGSSTSMQGKSLLSPHQQLDSPFTNYGVSGYSMKPLSSQLGNFNLPPLFENAAATAMGLSGMDSRGLGGSIGSPRVEHNLNRSGNQFAGNGGHAPFIDPTYLQYLRTVEYAAALHDPAVDKTYMGNGYVDLLEKAYLGALVSPQKSQYNLPLGGKGSGSNYYYGNPTYGLGMAYPGSPLANSVVPNSPVGPSSPMQFSDFNMRFSGGTRNIASGVMGPWHLNSMDNSIASTLLEEFKSNKMNCFELSAIRGHVIEFSADQYGSRFIQQKLETATTEEKNTVFQEIIPQALTLMTDVFGNYVIQKFFEYGMETQRRELANKLFGHVLTLSLQMYGCRVIQKAIEVVDVDQKKKMVDELDGHVMRCVRDQNGNHVVQKCIECVPEDHIQFIVSTFYGQVVTLSTHPYGCRVIQRVLEHCKDPMTQSKVMEEILGSVSMLAQDQYGNYVIQHLLEHGNSVERTTIIQELAGNIVQMSQQKFASNVVEKCLTFGDPSERQLLVNEMMGLTDENEPLQAMMKDQFANYVVQKVLETCSDQERELILSRIKVHLNALKKYTYGKHIVARVEKLVAAGERRIASQCATPA